MPMRMAHSPHAQDQLRERRLPEEEVARAIQEPEQVVDGGSGSPKIAQRRIQHAGTEYLLRVIYEEHEDELTIITVYRTSKVSKYWRKA